MRLLSILKNKVREATAKQPERIDQNLPLRLRLGRIVTISPDKFILSNGAIKLSRPPEKMKVVALGSLSLYGVKYYQFYLESPDGRERFLQVDSEGREFMLYEMTWCDESISRDDCIRWCNETNGLLGYRDFELDGAQYSRVIDQDGETWIKPLFYTEIVTDDEFDPEVARAAHTAMLFGRPVNFAGREFTENMLAEIVEDPKGAYIACRAGLLLDPADIQVL